MDTSTVKKITCVPSFVVSVLLVGMTLGSAKVDASPAVNTPIQGKQIAWWGGNGWGGGYGYGSRCGYGGCGYNHNGCGERCWRNRWGRVRCGNSCWY